MTFLHRFNPMLVILVATIITVYQMFSDPLSTPIADALGYLTTAVNLDVHGVFAYTYVQPTDGPPQPDIFFAPLYPALLTVIAKLSPGFSEYIACVVHARGTAVAEAAILCPPNVNAAIILQCALAVLSSVLVYLAAFLVFGRKRYAWLAMFLALATGEYAYYATQYLTETLVFPLFTLATLFVVYAWRKPSVLVWVMAGITLGLLALVRPSFIYLAYFIFFYQVVLFVLQKSELHWAGISRLAASIIAFCLIVGPWLIRNWIVHDIPAISEGYASFILVQRVAYNAMTLNEWLVSWIYWLPDFGDSLTASLFSPELYNRLSFDHPSSFYKVGNTTLRAATLEAAGGSANHLGYLLREYVFENFGKHVLVTLSLAWRGVWVSKNPGAIMLLLFIPILISSLRKRQYQLLMFSLPSWFMLGFHAFVSVSISRYNLVMIPGLALGASAALVWFVERLYGSASRLTGTRSDEYAGNGN